MHVPFLRGVHERVPRRGVEIERRGPGAGEVVFAQYGQGVSEFRVGSALASVVGFEVVGRRLGAGFVGVEVEVGFGQRVEGVRVLGEVGCGVEGLCQGAFGCVGSGGGVAGVVLGADLHGDEFQGAGG